MFRRVVILSSLCLLNTTQLSDQSSAVLASNSEPPKGFAFVPAQDGAVGSTMTLQQLQQAQRKTEQPQEPLIVKPAAEPSPALKYRLYPARWELRPGSALLHYARAQMLFSQMPKEKQGEWQMWFSDEKHPADNELALAVVALQHVFEELHDLAQSDDLTWDHRVRDLRGPEVYSYLLPDVQEVRTMARLLRLKIKHQLKQQDFDGAISSISDGLRLAEFVGQGETLIQKLVGIAVASLMRDCIQDAIATPGCPNLYWALATIPQPLVNVSESVLWELSNVQRVLPALAEAETANWTEEESVRKWGSVVGDLKALTGLDGADDNGIQLALAIASVTFVDAARARLLAGGLSDQRLSEMPAMHIVLLDASRELRRVGDDLGRAHLLPASLSKPLFESEDAKFQQWIGENRMSSVGAAVAGTVFPAVRQAKEAETRMLLGHNRLMTVEALRMHAAQHNGDAPKSLDELSPVPAMLDPYTNKPMEYRVDVINGSQTVYLKAAEPLNFKPLQELEMRFIK